MSYPLFSCTMIRFKSGSKIPHVMPDLFGHFLST